MIWKILTILVVLFVVYLVFFKKSREQEINKKSKKKKEQISDEMVECPTCGVFVSQNEALLSNGKFYCSKDCLNNK